jgi:beta-galactosidase/beta-glucuronidase
MNQANGQKIPRPEYPRPNFKREHNWINLNGEWDFSFDDDNIGLEERWYKKQKEKKFDKKIIVPFCFQSKLSGIEDLSFHDVVWYRKEFEIPSILEKKRILLHFGAVDYRCIVFLNGERVGSHEGGYIGFTIDITDYIEKGNILVLRVEDPSQDLEIPRGKQFWFENLTSIFYPRVTGIWQTVWLESVSLRNHIKSAKITPNIDKSQIIVECDVAGKGSPELKLSAEILFNNQSIAQEVIDLDFLGDLKAKRDRKIIRPKGAQIRLKNPSPFKFRIKIPKDKLHLWDVESPDLYDLKLTIYNPESQENYDEVKSYFGMRKISLSEVVEGSNRRVLLNNKPLYQKLLLVQGYWADGLYTAPSDEAIKLDVQFVKDFGFNGLRTHQKVFDPRFLYWCDKMGVLVWGEIGNAFQFSSKAQLRIIDEFAAEIDRDFNHPSIIVWAVLNEGWGIQGAHRNPEMVDYTVSLYHLMKSLDHTRLIVDNDGWFHTKTDLCTIHLYKRYELLADSLKEEKEFELRSAFPTYLEPYSYNNEPIIYSEIGGFGLEINSKEEDKKDDAWGYGVETSSEELLKKVIELFKLFDVRKEWIHGFCYTELYDQFQEVNGLLTMRREPKFPPSKLKKELDKLFY